MKVEELIHKLEKMEPDWDLRVLVARDGKLTVYGTDVAETIVIRKTEVEGSEDKVLKSDTYCYWDEK